MRIEGVRRLLYKSPVTRTNPGAQCVKNVCRIVQKLGRAAVDIGDAKNAGGRRGLAATDRQAEIE